MALKERDLKKYTVWDQVTPVAVVSSTDATPIVVTATAHGFSNGDLVMIYGHTTNVAANGIFKVASKTANTFALTDRYTGANVAGSGAGAGSSGVLMPAKVIDSHDFKDVEMQIATTGTATLTVKLAGSSGVAINDIPVGHGDTPNFGSTLNAAQGSYSFMNLIDALDGSAIAGNTGVVVAGTDINKMLEVNMNALGYICPIVTSWSAGKVTLILICYTL